MAGRSVMEGDNHVVGHQQAPPSGMPFAPHQEMMPAP
jgi:hypothetical protein